MVIDSASDKDQRKGAFVPPLIDIKTPHCRLSRPGIKSIRVIPPLRGLETCYGCSWCGVKLFHLANVVRLDRVVGDALPPSGATSARLSGRLMGPPLCIADHGAKGTGYPPTGSTSTSLAADGPRAPIVPSSTRHSSQSSSRFSGFGREPSAAPGGKCICSVVYVCSDEGSDVCV